MEGDHHPDRSESIGAFVAPPSRIGKPVFDQHSGNINRKSEGGKPAVEAIERVASKSLDKVHSQFDDNNQTEPQFKFTRGMILARRIPPTFLSIRPEHNPHHDMHEFLLFAQRSLSHHTVARTWKHPFGSVNLYFRNYMLSPNGSVAHDALGRKYDCFRLGLSLRRHPTDDALLLILYRVGALIPADRRIPSGKRVNLDFCQPWGTVMVKVPLPDAVVHQDVHFKYADWHDELVEKCWMEYIAST